MTSTDRATRWSITWYPPAENAFDAVESEKIISEYMLRQLPPGWKLEGQMEKCPETLRHHLQALLKTPQVRFSQIKKIFSNAHIEVARNASALENYVHKEDTRVAQIKSAPPVMTLYEFSDYIASIWDSDEWETIASRVEFGDFEAWDEAKLKYVDRLVSRAIRDGIAGAEFHGVNPSFRSAWKKFGTDIIHRYNKKQETSKITENENNISGSNIQDATYA